MKRKWTETEAWSWYNSQKWLRGCNFIGSDCCSRIDQWQSLHRAEHMVTADRELGYCEALGYNTVRLIVEFDVWLQEHESFLSVLEEYISLCAKHGQKVMLVLAHEAVMCRGSEYVPKKLGEQEYALGYHQGRFPIPPEELAKPAVHALQLDGWREKYLAMIGEIVGIYAHDERVLCWNVYNEPGIKLGERAIPLLELVYETARAQDPDQPLCADVWRGMEGDLPATAEERRALELGDVVSWHSYSRLEYFIPAFERVKALGRPVLLTEWLNRCTRSEVREIYPVLYLENVANWCWGCVVGKTQTNEPWDALWDQYEKDPNVDYDFTRWQHDLFRPNGRPYDPRETELIRRYNTLAESRGR